MKGKMFKKVLLFASLFCLLFTMLAVSSSALTADDYPTLEDYRAKTTLQFASYVTGVTTEQLLNAFPISSLRVDDGNGDYQWVPIPFFIQFSVFSAELSGLYTFDMAMVQRTMLDNGVGLIVDKVSRFDDAGDPVTGGARLTFAYVDSGSGDDYNLQIHYYDDTIDYDLTGEVVDFILYTNKDYYSSLEQYEGTVYDTVTIQLNEPSVTDTITNNWGEIFGWAVGALSSVQSVFYTNGSLTFLGTLAVVGVAIAIAFLFIGVVQKFLSLRG